MAFLAKRGLNAAGIRRGFEVYRQVCSKCHSLKLFKFEDLRQLGYSKDQILYYADGKRISKRIDVPYLSEARAKAANNGVVPPDLSLVVKRKGVDFIRRVLLGYTRARTPPPPHYYYNNGFDSGVTLMPPVLTDGVVKYASRAHEKLFQYVSDVSEFLKWVSEPWANLRGRLVLPTAGVFGLICVLLLSVLRKTKDISLQ
ncbi:cytochrome c1 [Candidatus Hodgkinia cicadicola]